MRLHHKEMYKDSLHLLLNNKPGYLDGQLMQVIAPILNVPLHVVDLRNLAEVKREDEALLLATEEAKRPFDLERGPLIRAIILQLEAKGHILLLTAHHIVFDGWSLGVLFRELTALYHAFSNGQPSPLPELPMQ